MASVNKVLLIGNLGRDPELRYLPSGDAVANLQIATTEKWKDKSGEQQAATEWHRVSFFGRLAEVCGEYLRKGSSVYVEGSIRTRKYTDKDGVEKYVTEIKGERLQMLGDGKGGKSSDRPLATVSDRKRTADATADQPREPLPGGFDDMESDIPF